MTGVIFALLSAVLFGLYIVPRKLSKLPAVQFSTLMAFSFTIGSILLYVLQITIGNNEGLYDPDLWYAVLAGILWATALVLLVKSIDIIGIARSNQWKNLQGPVGVILALIILGEATSVNPWFAVLSGFAIFGSAVIFNISSDKHNKEANRRAIILAALSGVLFGTVSLINKHVTDSAGVYSQQVIWSISILLSLVTYQLVTNQWSGNLLKHGRDTFFGLSSGVLYLGASAFMLLSFERMEASIAFTIIQMNFIIVVLLGIFVFKEFSFKGNQIRILFGLIFATVGVILLSLAR